MRKYREYSRNENEKEQRNSKDINTSDKRGMATVQKIIQRKKNSYLMSI